MPRLRDYVASTEARQDMVRQSAVTIENIVKRQKGVIGAAIRTGYRMARGLAPGKIEEMTDLLFDDFLEALTPFYHEAVLQERPVAAYIASQDVRVTERLLTITDERARIERSGPLRSGYDKLRKISRDRIVDAIPDLARLVETNLPEGAPGCPEAR